MVMRHDGTRAESIGEELITGPDEWTQFAGWSPDGATAIVGLGWQDPNNGVWEDQHRQFRMEPGKWRYDSWLVDVASRAQINVTRVDRVSHYNTISYTPAGDALLMTSLVDGTSKPFLMDLDGHNKRDLSLGGRGFAYGLNASPDGARVAYHEDYQIYVAETNGTQKLHIETGNPFNFVPQWSSDGKWLLFVSGEHYDCHPHIVRADGTGLRKLADRGGYRGVTEILDVPDFHGGAATSPFGHATASRSFTRRPSVTP